MLQRQRAGEGGWRADGQRSRDWRMTTTTPGERGRVAARSHCGRKKETHCLRARETGRRTPARRPQSSRSGARRETEKGGREGPDLHGVVDEVDLVGRHEELEDIWKRARARAVASAGRGRGRSGVGRASALRRKSCPAPRKGRSRRSKGSSRRTGWAAPGGTLIGLVAPRGLCLVTGVVDGRPPARGTSLASEEERRGRVGRGGGARTDRSRCVASAS